MAGQIDSGFIKNNFVRNRLGFSRPKITRTTKVIAAARDQIRYSELNERNVDNTLARHFESRNIPQKISSEHFAMHGYVECPDLWPTEIYQAMGEDVRKAFVKIGQGKDEWVSDTLSRRRYNRIAYRELLSHVTLLPDLHSSKVLLAAVASIVNSSNIRNAEAGVARYMSDDSHVQGWHTDPHDYALLTIWESNTDAASNSRVDVLRLPEDAPLLPAGAYPAIYPKRIKNFTPETCYLLNTRQPHCVTGSKNDRYNLTLFLDESSV